MDQYVPVDYAQQDCISTIASGRARIDEVDAQIIGLLKERRRISVAIQQERLAAGGVRIELSREHEIVRRYHSAFGSAGSAIASAILEVSRGKLGG